MKRFLFLLLMILPFVRLSANADTIKWVDFGIPYESLRYAMEQDITTYEQEKHISWIDILSLAACRTGGKCGLQSVKKAAGELKGERSPMDLAGDLAKYYNYYHDSFAAALGGLPIQVINASPNNARNMLATVANDSFSP